MSVKYERNGIVSDQPQPIISRTSRIDINKAVRIATVACADGVRLFYTDGKPAGVSFTLGLVKVRLTLGFDYLVDGLSFILRDGNAKEFRPIIRCQGGDRVTAGELLCAISDLMSDGGMHERLTTPAERTLYTKTLELSLALMRTIIQD